MVYLDWSQHFCETLIHKKSKSLTKSKGKMVKNVAGRGKTKRILERGLYDRSTQKKKKMKFRRVRIANN